MTFDLEAKVADELNLKVGQVKRTVELFDKGNTIPFVARYRKEVTDNLDEVQLRKLVKRVDYLRRLENRKEEIIAIIDKQDKLTEELEEKIREAGKLQEIEDLYRPYKQKRQTRATKAIEKGLEPLADLFFGQDIKDGDVDELAGDYLDRDQDLNEIGDVLQGVNDIIAQHIADHPESRRLAREITFSTGYIVSEAKVEERTEYEIYYDYRERIKKVPPYRTLAFNRGEAEDVLHIKVEADVERIIDKLKDKFIKEDSIFTEYIEDAINDAYMRLIAPAIEREVRNDLTDKAEEHAIKVFAKNLRNLLLQPPLQNKRVLAVDPGYRTGSKIVALNEMGSLLDYATIYPHPPQNKVEDAKEKLTGFIKEYDLKVIAIGNGTACRETEQVVAELIDEINEDIKYIIVSEAGASVYSASTIAGEEFPDLDVSIRGAISIGRRLQDPLAELVKIAPKHIGVGMYQHDLSQTRLEDSLADVIESVVNYVGVDLNTASSSLLNYVAGINSNVAKNIIEYREEKGGFKRRKELKDVYRLGPKTFTQAAGFLKIKKGKNPLDQTPIHPESYQVAESLLAEMGFAINDLRDKELLSQVQDEIKELDLSQIVGELEVGLPTLKDIVEALLKPDRDPREELSKPLFRTDILKMEDLKEGMVLYGTVRNVVDFGAFVDIGVKQDGLVHISKLSKEYVTDPLQVVAIGDTVKVKILEVDIKRERISLTMNF